MDPEAYVLTGGMLLLGIGAALKFSILADVDSVVDVVVVAGVNGATAGDACAFNCHCCCTCGVSIRRYRGLPCVNGIYRYLIMCWKDAERGERERREIISHFHTNYEYNKITIGLLRLTRMFYHHRTLRLLKNHKNNIMGRFNCRWHAQVDKHQLSSIWLPRV